MPFTSSTRLAKATSPSSRSHVLRQPSLPSQASFSQANLTNFSETSELSRTMSGRSNWVGQGNQYFVGHLQKTALENFAFSQKRALGVTYYGYRYYGPTGVIFLVFILFWKACYVFGFKWVASIYCVFDIGELNSLTQEARYKTTDWSFAGNLGVTLLHWVKLLLERTQKGGSSISSRSQ